MRLFLSFLLILMSAQGAQAQNIYLRNSNPAPLPAKPEQQRETLREAPVQRLAPAPERIEPPIPAPNAPQPTAPTPSGQSELDRILNNGGPNAPQSPTQYANSYYNNCIKQQHPILKGEDLKLLCGCTSVKFAQNMTPAQVNAMREDSVEGQNQRNRVLMFVYAPCMQAPIRALILDECLKSTPNKFLMKDQPKTCACLADGVSADLQKDAPRVIEESIRNNPNAVDPLANLLNSKTFENRQRYHSRVCVQKYGVGLGGLGGFLQ